MNFMNKKVLIILVCILVSFYCLASAIKLIFLDYKSAFEADRACHYDLYIRNTSELKYDCDHDLETRQWLLYNESEEKNIAIVIKRYHY